MKYQTYTKYKPSGVEWIGEIPVEWEVNRFKINFSYKKGKSPKNLDSKSDDYFLPYLSMGYLRGKENEVLYSPADVNAVLVNEGDLLLLWDGANAGEFAKGKKGYLSSTMVKFDLKNIQNKYADNLCTTVEPVIRSLTIGMGIPHVNGDALNNIVVPIPKENEQQKIADFLHRKTSQIDGLIKKDKRLIELLQERRIALINQAVTKGIDPNAKLVDSGVDWIGEIPEGWEVRRLKEVSDVLISNVDKKSKPGEPDVFLCNYVDVYKNEFIDSKIDFMKATATIEQINKLGVECGDVIITKDSETPEDIAVPAYVRGVVDKLVCGYHLALIKTNKNKILGEYLFRLFQSKKINSYFEVEANGVTRFGVSTYPIKNLSVCLPTISEQKSIVKFVNEKTEQIDEHIKKILHRIKLLEEYKKSLIYNTVTGKIKV